MEIKKCPFHLAPKQRGKRRSHVGTVGVILRYTPGWVAEHRVLCYKCDAYGPKGKTDKDAIRKWNKRI